MQTAHTNVAISQHKKCKTYGYCIIACRIATKRLRPLHYTFATKQFSNKNKHDHYPYPSRK